MKKKAFTLIELVVVVAIIGLLTALMVPIVQKAMHKKSVAESYSTQQSPNGQHITPSKFSKDQVVFIVGTTNIVTIIEVNLNSQGRWEYRVIVNTPNGPEEKTFSESALK